MRRRPTLMTQLLQQGGPFTGANKPVTRVTVEPTWYLSTTSGPVGNTPQIKLPLRWYQDVENSQVEVEIPNLKTVITDKDLTEDAATIEVDFYITKTPNIGSAGDNLDVFGQPGFYSWNYGGTPLARERWGQVPNVWTNLLRENALLRVYQGYGGIGLTIPEALAAGNIIQTGVYLVDTVAIEASAGGGDGTGGIGKLTGRDMCKLLIDQYAYPPLVPQTFYAGDPALLQQAGIVYYFDTTITIPAVPGYGAPGGAGTTLSPLEGFSKSVLDFALSSDGKGYRLAGTDGGVFDYGSSVYQGSQASSGLPGQIVGMDNTPTNGYWLCGANGSVYNFGGAVHYGDLLGEGLSAQIVAFRATRTGNGYWLCGGDGAIYTFGDAKYHGGKPTLPTHATITAFAPTPTGGGYWMLGSTGSVYSFGALAYHGGLDNMSAPNPIAGSIKTAGIDATPSGNGYRIADSIGGVYDFGDAQYFTATGGVPAISEHLSAPISNIRHSVDNLGFYLVGMDGGIFTYGDAHFYGSMPGTDQVTVGGNYSDYTDIVKDFLLWSGFYLHTEGLPANESPPVYGTIEKTGAYDAIGPIDPSTFDKVQVIDCIKALAQTVSFIYRANETGGFNWTVPNWWSNGNFYDDTGEPTSYIPQIDERLNMTDWIQISTDQPLRSEIIVSPQDPYLFNGTPPLTTVTRLIPPNIQALRGMVKTAMIGIPLNIPISKEDQDLLAELQALQCWFATRTGQVTCVFDPSICPDDQIQIFERSTGETGIYYVTGVHVEHDLDTGQCLGTYSVQWLGASNNWAITSNFNSFFGQNSGGTAGVLTDQTFGATGNLTFSDSFQISTPLATFLANTGSRTTSIFRLNTIIDDSIQSEEFPNVSLGIDNNYWDNALWDIDTWA